MSVLREIKQQRKVRETQRMNEENKHVKKRISCMHKININFLKALNANSANTEKQFSSFLFYLYFIFEPQNIAPFFKSSH